MNHKLNQFDHVTLTNHVLSAAPPVNLVMAGHTLQVCGVLGSSSWSGVCGTESAARAHALAQRLADARLSNYFTVHTWVPLRDLAVNKGRMTKQQVLHTGYLHLDRIKAEFRDELHGCVLDRLVPNLDARQMGQLRSEKLGDLMARFPIAAEFLLDAYPSVTLVAHPARLIGGDGRPVWIGTIRRQDLQQCRSQMRYLEEECPVS